MTTDENALLTQYLKDEGCSESEIERVLKKLDDHDDQTMRESVFDSIAAGTFSLKAIIDELRDDEDDSNDP